MNSLSIFGEESTYPLHINGDWDVVNHALSRCSVIVIDKKVINLHSKYLDFDLNKAFYIDADESIKTPQTALDICEKLTLMGVTRGQIIGAVGGGIVQDLVTFASSFYMRGIDWLLFPTTLLAQADSCIGGKSSINFKQWKNLLGNFYNPSEIYIQPEFLETLENKEIRSGIGEIMKVFLLSGPAAVSELQRGISSYQKGIEKLDKLIYRALVLKNNILKLDALDKGPRLKMNYGHSFGHALESATQYRIPHGIAVTIGLDMANYFSLQQGFIDKKLYQKLQSILYTNLLEEDFVIPIVSDFIDALEKDKKNKPGMYGLVLPVALGKVELQYFCMNSHTNEIIKNYFEISYGK